MVRIVTKDSQTSPPSPPDQEEKPFYGWRYIEHVGPDGKVQVETKLLTLEDVLHPQEDDVIPENSLHGDERVYLKNVVGARESRLDRGLVLSDCLIDWGIPSLGNHSPDISAFDGLKNRPSHPIGTFRLRPSGGRCVTAIEIVSPHTRKTDVDSKPDEYHQAKVPLFIIIDQKKEGGPRELFAYRWTPARYVKEKLDDRGRVLIEELGIRLGLKDNKIVCWDADSDQELGGYTELEAAWQQQAQAREVAEQQARDQAQAREAAEKQARDQAQAREAAEQQARAAKKQTRVARELAREQAQAREAAEQQTRVAREQAREQVQAREAAEQLAREQARAKEAAEQLARAQAEAREAAEKRILELEAALRRLEKKPGGG